MALIYHLAYRNNWDQARRAGEYLHSTKGRTLEQQGFIHACANPAQVEQVANTFYRGDSDLLVLIIDEARVRSEVRHEAVGGFDTPLPHIYGPLNADAVVDTAPLEVAADGELRFIGVPATARMFEMSSVNRWVGVAIDCADAGPVAHFYQRLLGFEIGELSPPGWAQLRDPGGGVHINIQGQDWYRPPTWPERPGMQAKMMHFEVEVDDLETAIATALEAGGTEAPWQPPDRNRERLRIMLDPAGHPLCLFLEGE